MLVADGGANISSMRIIASNIEQGNTVDAIL